MRDLNIKKNNDNDRILKILAVIVLTGTAFLVLAALAVGLIGWWMLKRPDPGTGAAVMPMPPARLPPRMPGAFGPQGPARDGPLQSLPTPPLPKMKQPAPPTPPKRIAFTAIRSMDGHAGPVFAVALSADGHHGLSGGSDKSVRWWDLDRGQERAKLEGHTDAVRGVTLAPDGKHTASASLDGTVRLWDLANKTSIHTLKGHEGAVLCVAFTPDGKRLLSGGSDRSLRLWDVETGKPLQQWYGHDAGVQCVAVSPDGASALTGSTDGGATHWDLRTGRELAYLSLDKPVSFALFTADGKRAIVGGDAPARLCDLSNGEQWAGLAPAGPALSGAALLPGKNVFLQVTGKRLEGRFLPMEHVDPSIFNDPRWNLLGEIEAPDGAFTCVRASSNGRLALTAGTDGAVKLWSIHEQDGGKAH